MPRMFYYSPDGDRCEWRAKLEKYEKERTKTVCRHFAIVKKLNRKCFPFFSPRPSHLNQNGYKF